MDGGLTVGTLALATSRFPSRQASWSRSLGQVAAARPRSCEWIAGLTARPPASFRSATSPITRPSTERGLVFQDPNLFPWRTIRRNIEADLVARGVPGENRHQVDEYMRLAGMESFANSFPYNLSGGMAHRISSARALINQLRFFSSMSRWARSMPLLACGCRTKWCDSGRHTERRCSLSLTTSMERSDPNHDPPARKNRANLPGGT